MAVVSSRAVREQLSVIMAALSKAALAEICEVLDEGYARLQLEIRRSRAENEDLKKKLHLIQSIVVRGGGAGEPGEPGDQPPETPQQQQQQQQRGGGGGDPAGGDQGDVVMMREELLDVVLIKDEDSDSNDTFEEDNAAAAAGECVASTAVGRSAKRHWPSGEEEEANRKSSSPPLTPLAEKKSVTVYSLDSPRGEPGFSGQLGADEMEAGESVCSYSSQMDPDVQLVHQDCSLVPPPGGAGRPAYFGSGSLTESPTNRELDLSLTWTKQAKGHGAFSHFHQSESADGDAFGLKMISVTGSISTDCPLSEGSNSAFEYDDAAAAAAAADMMNFSHYRDPSGHHPPPCHPPPGGAPRGGGGKRFVCAMCSKSYATCQNLEVHMRIHTGERPFCCGQCGKKFTQSAHLKSHLSVHSGERPYACSLCSRSFIVKYSLKLHMKKCHDSVLSE